jgi:peptidoglycan hydrolase-like protein with peptidoglycan-binding domain
LASVRDGEQNVEFPEKENELRKAFFASLDKKLQLATTASQPEPQVVIKPTSVRDTTPDPKAESMTVAEIQKRLLELGYQPGRVDGDMGKKTTDALRKFQKNNSLPTTGKPDRETVLKLRSQER